MTTTLRAPRGLAGVIADGRRSSLSLEQIRSVAPSVFATEKHSSRSDRFGFVSTESVLRGLLAEGFQPVSVRQGRSRVAGKEAFTKHIIRLTHGTSAMQMRHGSCPEVILLNSHDGTSAYRLMAGVWRAACDNGMVVAESLLADLRVPHTLRAVQNVIAASWEVVNRVHEVMGTVERWSATRNLTARNLMDFAEAAHALRFDADSQAGQAISPRNLLDIRRDEDSRLDLYTVFNVVQENIIRGGQDYVQVRRIERDNGQIEFRNRAARVRPIQSVDDDVQINRNLWDLAARLERELA